MKFKSWLDILSKRNNGTKQWWWSFHVMLTFLCVFWNQMIDQCAWNTFHENNNYLLYKILWLKILETLKNYFKMTVVKLNNRNNKIRMRVTTKFVQINLLFGAWRTATIDTIDELRKNIIPDNLKFEYFLRAHWKLDIKLFGPWSNFFKEIKT